MENNLDPVAVAIFAEKGIELIPVTKREYAWTHAAYHKSLPPVKDLLVEIHEVDYMGPVVHSTIVPNVHFEDAYQVAEKVLADFQASLAAQPKKPKSSSGMCP